MAARLYLAESTSGLYKQLMMARVAAPVVDMTTLADWQIVTTRGAIVSKQR